MAIKLRVECTDCDTVEDYEASGCFVIIFNEDGTAVSLVHHARMSEVLPIAVRQTLRELLEREMEFNKLIKGGG
jgi:hypothetical protein